MSKSNKARNNATNANAEVETIVAPEANTTTNTNTVVKAPKTKDIPTLTAEQTKELATHQTVSGQIRYLDSLKMERGDISRLLTKLRGTLVRYQHVRNVLTTPMKRKAPVATA